MGKSECPTLFQVNGPVGLASWKDYCADLSDTEVYKQLTSEDFALKDGDKVAGIGYVIESYGIICNKKLLAEAGYSVKCRMRVPFVTQESLFVNENLIL